jgi:hypothetical protein
MINNRVLNENDMKRTYYYNIDTERYNTMIFRDKKTGSLLNIRRDEYVNDRIYYTEIMRIGNGGASTTRPLRYTRTFEELQSDNNNT